MALHTNGYLCGTFWRFDPPDYSYQGRHLGFWSVHVSQHAALDQAAGQRYESGLGTASAGGLCRVRTFAAVACAGHSPAVAVSSERGKLVAGVSALTCN